MNCFELQRLAQGICHRSVCRIEVIAVCQGISTHLQKLLSKVFPESHQASYSRHLLSSVGSKSVLLHPLRPMSGLRVFLWEYHWLALCSILGWTTLSLFIFLVSTTLSSSSVTLLSIIFSRGIIHGSISASFSFIVLSEKCFLSVFLLGFPSKAWIFSNFRSIADEIVPWKFVLYRLLPIERWKVCRFKKSEKWI